MSDNTNAPVLAGPPGDCCIQGVKHVGEPAGKALTINGLETYVSEPPSSYQGPPRVILYFSDVFGAFYLNNQLIQDYFASNGFTVLGIDYFFSDPINNRMEEPGFDLWAWVADARKKANPAVPGWVEAVINQYGSETKYCAVGYCFGAPYALELATTDKIVAAAFAHPTHLNESHFTQMKKPLLLSCSEDDMTFPTESRRRAEDLLVQVKATYLLQVFSGVSHGFAVRADLSVENSRWAKEESARSVIGWFNRFAPGSHAHL